MALHGTSWFRYQCINEKKKLKTGSARDRLIKRHTKLLTEMLLLHQIARVVILEAMEYELLSTEICFCLFCFNRFSWTGASKRVL